MSVDGLSVIKLCAIRITQLTDTGALADGTCALFVSDAGIEFKHEPQSEAGDKFTEKNGCGTTCVDFEDCATVPRVKVSTQLCRFDFELSAALFGGTVVFGDTGDSIPIGWNPPDPLAACADGVCVETYSVAWSGKQRLLHPISGLPAYFRRCYPKVLWTPGSETLNNGASRRIGDGIASSNTEAGTGPDCDWAAVPDGAWLEDLVDSIPTADTQCQDRVAC